MCGFDHQGMHVQSKEPAQQISTKECIIGMLHMQTISTPTVNPDSTAGISLHIVSVTVYGWHIGGQL